MHLYYGCVDGMNCTHNPAGSRYWQKSSTRSCTKLGKNMEMQTDWAVPRLQVVLKPIKHYGEITRPIVACPTFSELARVDNSALVAENKIGRAQQQCHHPVNQLYQLVQREEKSIQEKPKRLMMSGRLWYGNSLWARWILQESYKSEYCIKVDFVGVYCFPINSPEWSLRCTLKR